MTPAPSPGRIETLDGVSLYYEVHGSGEPLLLLHGFTGSSQDWPVFPAEWNSHFQIVAPDLRGHGRSTNRFGTFRHDQAAADVFALLDRLGITAFKGLGVSAGGNVLLHLATQQPGA